MCNPSFVNNNSLKKLTTVQFITICKSDSRKILENYDLTDVNFSNVADKKVLKNFDGYTIKNVIFSRFNPSKKDKKHLYGLSFIGAKLERVCFAQAFLEKCNFDNKKPISLMRGKLYKAFYNQFLQAKL